MALVLAATGLFVFLQFRSDLDATLDQGLRSRADEVAARGSLGEGTGIRLVEAEEAFAQIVGPDGRVRESTEPVGDRPLLTEDELARAREGTVIVDRDELPAIDDPVRLLARPAGSDVVVVGTGRDDRDESLSSLVTVLLLGGAGALVVVSLVGYGLTSAALRPVASMRRRAAEISRLGSGRRLPVPEARDELAELGSTLNEMLDRLEHSAERERSFVASASHELRTPLALLKGELELALREGRTPEELREAVASAAEESDRLTQLAEDLLVLARSDEGELPVQRQRLAADELLEGVARRFAGRAREQGRELRVEAADALELDADRLRVEQALGNLVDNALRHGEGPVTLSANGGVELHVTDEGPGVPPELGAGAFDRFTRGDQARSRGGTGLGLAIVRAIAEAHGGSAHAATREGGGADVWVELPPSPRW